MFRALSIFPAWVFALLSISALAGLGGPLPAHATNACESSPGTCDGSIRITSPGGLLLHQSIAFDDSFSPPIRFQVNAPGKGINNRNLEIYGEVSVNAKGLASFRGQCVEKSFRPSGKMMVAHSQSTPFGGSLEHGRHTASACQGVLVQVQLPGWG